MQRIALLIVLGALLAPFDAAAGQPPSPADAPVFVAYYWRARPGKVDEYSDYIKHTAEAIDEDARRAGVFEEVRTVTPAPGTAVDWTHLRIFRLKNAAAEQALGADWMRRRCGWCRMKRIARPIANARPVCAIWCAAKCGPNFDRAGWFRCTLTDVLG
jgi:hypothetical protein